MFGKKQPHLEIIIGPESSVRGEVMSKGTVRIDGVLEGSVAAECVIVGETGSVTGEVAARSLIVGGKIFGNVRASEVAEIRPRGEIHGDIYAARLVMAEGSKFEGHSYMQLTPRIEFKAEEVVQEW